MEPSTESALVCLESLGFRIEVIAETNAPRADLRAWIGNDEEYVIEAKGRELSKAIRQLHQHARVEGFGTITRDLGPSNAVSRRLLRAAEQLEATPAREGAFRLIWVLAEHDDEDFELDCVAKRLHGLAELTVTDPTAFSVSTKPCYYYSANDFRRMPAVHGAVLCGARGYRLLINSFCKSREAFRASSFCERLAKAGAVEDPEILEGQGLAFLIGDDFQSNGTGGAQWSYIKTKYGALTSKMREVQLNGVAISSLSVGAKKQTP